MQGQIQQGVFVTGTDTDVGKTWVGQMIIRQLCGSGVHVIPRKPVESGWQDDVEKTDAWLLAHAAGKEEELELVCPNRFQAAVSPVRAAALEGKSLQISEVKQQCLEGVNLDDFLYVEGAGGFFSPLVNDGLNADLAKELGLPVLLVAEDKLGCINHILLSIAAIESYGLPVKGIVLNARKKADNQAVMNNLEDLQGLVSAPVFQVSFRQEQVAAQMLDALLALT